MYNRKKLISSFIDISSSSFPVDISIRNANDIYLRRINKFSKILKEAKILDNYTFLDVETEMNKIRGSGDEIIGNDLYHKIRNLFGYICSFHQNPSKYKENTIGGKRGWPGSGSLVPVHRRIRADIRPRPRGLCSKFHM